MKIPKRVCAKKYGLGKPHIGLDAKCLCENNLNKKYFPDLVTDEDTSIRWLR